LHWVEDAEYRVQVAQLLRQPPPHPFGSDTPTFAQTGTDGGEGAAAALAIEEDTVHSQQYASKFSGGFQHVV
jgi:hypothetical protein